MPSGEISALLAALTIAGGTVIDKYLTKKFTALSQMALRVPFGALFILLVFFLSGKASSVPEVSLYPALILIASAFTNLGLGDIAYLKFLKSVDANKAFAMGSALWTLFAVAAAVLFLGESLGLDTFLGGLVVVSGVYILSISQATGGTRRWFAPGIGLRAAAWLVVSAMSFGLGVVLLEIGLRDIDLMIAVTLRVSFTTFVILPMIAHRVASALDLGEERSYSIPGAEAGLSDGPGRAEDALYEGRVQLYVAPPVDMVRFQQLEGALSNMKGLVYKGVSGSPRKGLELTLEVPAATPLSKLLRKLPMIRTVEEDVYYRGSDKRIETTLAGASAPPREEASSMNAPAAHFREPKVRIVQGKGFPLTPLLLGAVAGILMYGLSSLLFLNAIQSRGAATSVILLNSSPVFLIPLSFLFLKERINLGTVIGIAATIVGIILVV